jgi:hypothetical protein
MRLVASNMTPVAAVLNAAGREIAADRERPDMPQPAKVGGTDHMAGNE